MGPEDTQQAEKVGLKRKLIGPPRLLLGKTRTRSTGEDRPEAKTSKVDQVDEPALKSAATEEVTNVTEKKSVAGVSVESCRRRRTVSGEDGDITCRKVNRARWWRRFVCSRRQKKNQRAEENNIHEERREFNVQTSYDSDKPSLSFQKKLRRFFTRAGRSSRSAVPQLDEVPSSSEAKERTKRLSPPDGRGEERAEAVMVMAEDLVVDPSDNDPGFSPATSHGPSELQSLQLSANRPSIRIELVPPDNVAVEDEEEEEDCGKGRWNQNPLQLLSSNLREQQLLQMARALVRAAVHAAVDELSGEEQDDSECVHREPQGCRDHA